MLSFRGMTSNNKASRYLSIGVPNLSQGFRRLDQLLASFGCTHAQPVRLHLTSSYFPRTADTPFTGKPAASPTRLPGLLSSKPPQTTNNPSFESRYASVLRCQGVVSPPVGHPGVSRTSATHAVCTSCLSTLAGLPATTTFGGTSRVTTLPDPMTLLSPMVMPGLMMAPPPIHTLFPILHENTDICFLENLRFSRRV